MCKQGTLASQPPPLPPPRSNSSMVKRLMLLRPTRRDLTELKVMPAFSGSLAGASLSLEECQKQARDPTLTGDEYRLIQRLVSLLRAQVDELRDIQPYTGNPRSSAQSILTDIYTKVHSSLTSIGKSEKRKDQLSSLLDVLLPGPDHLIDVSILENIVWQAEIIDSNFGADARIILDEAIRGQTDDPDTFRRAGESLIAVSSAIPRDLLDDHDAEKAYKAIGSLIIHLQARLGDEPRRPPKLPSTLSSVSAIDQTASPLVSASTSRPNSPIMTDVGYTKYSSASSLEAAFGTGPIPTPTPPSGQVSGTVTPRPPSSPTDTEASQEIWEYRGNLLTRSALSLVLRQEALAKADSSGQYAGEVSWDDVRQAYVPKWAEKMKPEDIVEGELPGTNPAEYRVRRKDAWGNDIGWRDGVMFYKNEPSFDTPADD